MELIIPNQRYKDSFIKALKNGFYVGSQSVKSKREIQDIEENFDSFLKGITSIKVDPTPVLRDDGKYYVNVPQITYWLVDNGEFIGEFALRTELNDFLKRYTGGNVGYGISPEYRRKGYATKGLALLIEKAKQRGMTELLVSAAESNLGSWKAIEKNGGVLESIIEPPWKNEKFKRYWIIIK